MSKGILKSAYYNKKCELIAGGKTSSGVKWPLLPVSCFPPEHVAPICLPLQDLFSCVENTIAHQRCLVAKKQVGGKVKAKAEYKTKRHSKTVTMIANHSRGSTAEQTSDLISLFFTDKLECDELYIM